MIELLVHSIDLKQITKSIIQADHHVFEIPSDTISNMIDKDMTPNLHNLNII